MSNKVQLGFSQIMGPCPYICMDRKIFSKVCIMLQCFSGSKQYSLKVVYIQITWECHYSLFQNLSNVVMSSLVRYLGKMSYLRLLVMQTLYISSSFSILIEQIDKFESILKLTHGIWNNFFIRNIFFVTNRHIKSI